MKQKKQSKHTICVVGAGHVGLVSAACFAELGHSVICIDNDPKKIARLKTGIMPFYEPELRPLVMRTVKNKMLHFSTSLRESVKKADIIFIAVGTPPLADGSADLTAIETVARTIAQNLNSYKLVIEKSTVPVQTGQKIKETIHRYRKAGVPFDVASNPEFLREGKAVYDSVHPDRIVIGVESERAARILQEIYAPLEVPVIVTDINTAEIIKHASNSFLATKISFINALARICDLTGANVEKVAEAMGLDTRIGKQFLAAGIGYGGFCFPKDLEAFIYISRKIGYNFGLLKEVKQVNDEQRTYFFEKVKEHLWVLKDKKIAILGLAFKPDTDDMRFAPSVDIVNALYREGAKLFLYDPKAHQEAMHIFSGKKLTFCKNAYHALKNCDCACFLTEWGEFKTLDFKKVKKLMAHAFIADGRNMFDKKALTALGFEYIGIGK
ncbi:MAG: UDP-glucose/GDP-mannose dehydrogenase family protein [Candidatus Omnitrophota bacterium]